MYNKILVPLDGSQLAERVLPYARFLATGLQLPVDLMQVNDPETLAPKIEPMRGADYLKETAASFPAPLKVNCRVESGAAADVIVDHGSKEPGTLIAMATHGLSGNQRWLLGHVSQRVLQASTSPLLLIRAKEAAASSSEARLSAVIVPLDGSKLAEKIFPHVEYLAARLDLRVLLLRTYTLPTASYFMAAGMPPPARGEVAATIRQEVSDYLKAKEETLRASGVTQVSSAVVEGKGPQEIIELARKTANSLVAMSTHGRSGMGRWVLGGVTDRVVCYGGDPVLVIRPASS